MGNSVELSDMNRASTRNILIFIEPMIVLNKPYLYSSWWNFAYRMMSALQRGKSSEYYSFRVITSEPVRSRIVQEHILPGLEIITMAQDELLMLFNFDSFGASLAWYKNTGTDAQLEYSSNLIQNKLGQWIPDIVITFTPVPYIKRAYPNALYLFHEYGFTSRPPFSESFFLDPYGCFKDSFLVKHKDEISRVCLSSPESDLLNEYKQFFVAQIEAHNPWQKLIGKLKTKFDHLILLPLQVERHVSFEGNCDFTSQFQMLQYVLSKIPSNIGVIVTVHPDFSVLTADVVEYLEASYPNFIYSPEFEEVQAASQYFLAHVDAVISISSSVGLQTLIWGKKLIALGSSHLALVADASNLDDVQKVLSEPKSNKDNILFWLLTRYFIPYQYFYDSTWLSAFLERAYSICQAGGDFSQLYQEIDAPGKIFQSIQASANLAIPVRKRKDNPVPVQENKVTFGDGFYQDEGGWRWMGPRARLNIPEGLPPSIIHFDLTAAEGENYKSLPFSVQIQAGAKGKQTIVFPSGSATEHIRIEIPAPADTPEICLTSEQYFVPFDLGLADLRPLSVRLSNFNVEPLIASADDDERGERKACVQEERPEAGRDTMSEVEAICQKGLDFLKQGKLSLARREFSRAVIFDPDYLTAQLYLADVLVRTNRMDEAETLLLQAVGKHPGDQAVLKKLSNFYHAIEREDKALEIEASLAESEKVGAAQEALSFAKVSSFEAYKQYALEMGSEYQRRRQYEGQLLNGRNPFEIEGFCYVCHQKSYFSVDYLYSYTTINGIQIPNWRERLVCAKCGMPNRIRASIHIFEQVLKPSRSAKIYLTEQITSLYQWMLAHYPGTVGSEFLGDTVDLGYLNSHGIRNEDLTRLTFANDHLDAILSFDVFEHVPDFRKALKECCRVLKAGGSLLFSVPFDLNSKENIVRAVMQEDGQIEHLLPPIYHGDPINSDGCLAFYTFGWELFDDLREAGFSDVNAYFYWSPEFAYLGTEQVVFIASKGQSPAAVGSDTMDTAEQLKKLLGLQQINEDEIEAAANRLGARFAKADESEDALLLEFTNPENLLSDLELGLLQINIHQAHADGNLQLADTLKHLMQAAITTQFEREADPHPQDKGDDLRSFCAAPWVEAVLYARGSLRTCCRNATSFGNWQEEGLKSNWHSAEFQEFRQKIYEGIYPDEQCKNCRNNGTARSLVSELHEPFHQYTSQLFNLLGRNIPEIESLGKLFALNRINPEADIIFAQFFKAVEALKKEQPLELESYTKALEKVRVMGDITKSYLSGDLTPPVVAPFRQVQLLAKCNARCIQCPGRYSGDIMNGPTLDEKYVDEAFSNSSDIIDFFMNGSEFLLYKDWKRTAKFLNEAGVKLSISTNSILLRPENIRYLIDNRVVQKLNVSIDGATKETIESTRVNVKYEHLLENLTCLFAYASEKKYDFEISISFVLMKRNYREFPELIRLIHHLSGNYPRQNLIVYCQALETYNTPGYREFYNQENHNLIERMELVKTFDDALAASKETGISVGAFYSYSLENFIKSGYPFPQPV